VVVIFMRSRSTTEMAQVRKVLDESTAAPAMPPMDTLPPTGAGTPAVA
jgi:hypothetical protein